MFCLEAYESHIFYGLYAVDNSTIFFLFLFVVVNLAKAVLWLTGIVTLGCFHSSALMEIWCVYLICFSWDMVMWGDWIKKKWRSFSITPFLSVMLVFIFSEHFSFFILSLDEEHMAYAIQFHTDTIPIRLQKWQFISVNLFKIQNATN